jgi:hypothetical protein
VDREWLDGRVGGGLVGSGGRVYKSSLEGRDCVAGEG